MAGGEKFAEAKPYADIFAKVYVEEIGNGVSDKDAKETAKYAAEKTQLGLRQIFLIALLRYSHENFQYKS
jgi:hypothetical protein